MLLESLIIGLKFKKTLTSAKTFTPDDSDTMHLELENTDGHCLKRSQHLFNKFSSTFILLFWKSFALHGPFFIKRLSSVLERNSAA